MKSKRLILFFMLGLVMVTGAAARLQNVAQTTIEKPIRADAAQYTAYAYNLRFNGVYSKDFGILTGQNKTGVKPDALRSPGYPLFLTLFNADFDLGLFYSKAVISQALLSATLIILAYLLARPFLGQAGGLSVAALTALSPHLINANNYLLTETLFSLLLAAGLALLVQHPSRTTWLMAGIMLGAAALARPTLQYFIVPLLIFLALHRHKMVRPGLVIWPVSGFLTLVGFWVFRNWWTLGISSDPTLALNTLLHGAYPGFMYEARPETFGFPYRYDPSSGEIAQSFQTLATTLLQRFQASPWEYLSWYLSKPLYLFQWDIVSGQGDIFVYPAAKSPYYDNMAFGATHTIMKLIHPTLVWLSFAGSIAAWLPNAILQLDDKGRFAARLVSLTYLYFVAVHIAGAPFPRYGIPLRPLTYSLGILGLIFFIRLSATLCHRQKAN